MCGIFISNNTKCFRDLYNSNRKRGDFSFGSLSIQDSLYSIVRSPEFIDPREGHTFLGHTRAPTGDVERVFNANENHPFEFEDWIVAHNGILKNFESLKYKYKLDVSVDTALIPRMLSNQDIISVLEELRGLWGLWIYNRKTNNIYVTRCGSTLYYSKYNNTISSARCYPDDILLKEGILYQYFPDKELTETATYKYDTPYFIL